MLSLLFVILAAIFKAVSDTLEHHFDTSVFRKLRVGFWDPDHSTAKFLPFTKYKVDAWHISNTILIVFFMAAIVFWKTALFGLGNWIWIIVLGVLFNLVFNLFYNKILRRVH